LSIFSSRARRLCLTSNSQKSTKDPAVRIILARVDPSDGHSCRFIRVTICDPAGRDRHSVSARGGMPRSQDTQTAKLGIDRPQRRNAPIDPVKTLHGFPVRPAKTGRSDPMATLPGRSGHDGTKLIFLVFGCEGAERAEPSASQRHVAGSSGLKSHFPVRSGHEIGLNGRVDRSDEHSSRSIGSHTRQPLTAWGTYVIGGSAGRGGMSRSGAERADSTKERFAF
jgi:hypothetical protein